jgi:A/G-specific adenine glycosylase
MRLSAQRVQRTSSLAAAKRISSQAFSEADIEVKRSSSSEDSSAAPSSQEDTDASEIVGKGEIGSDEEIRPAKRQKIEPAKLPKTTKTVKSVRKNGNAKLNLDFFAGQCIPNACDPRARGHTTVYHKPLLLDTKVGCDGRRSLLDWFDSVSTSRSMPWRKAWIDPRAVEDPDELSRQLARRAYEVWISEIMLQQTRVAVVIGYWNSWMAKWPTIEDLAAADPDDVLGAWRGLGYYSRATRIHEAAKLVVRDPKMAGMLPSETAELEARVPGVGRYTAGAISAIVFGHAAPMVDGNVLRVLSRQLGIYGNVKTNKTVIDALWATADTLVKAVAQDVPSSDDNSDSESEETTTSDRPGRWGQALMELGSTVCTPKPNCGSCPITSTCRAYNEGHILATKPNPQAAQLQDIEDLCRLCEPFEDVLGEGSGNAGDPVEKATATKAKGKSTKKQGTLTAFAFTRSAKSNEIATATNPVQKPNARSLEVIAEHARKFPVKVIKKAVREEETIVCVIHRADGQFLLHRRPEKGLLAGLWEFPSYTLPDTNDSAKAARKRKAIDYVSTLLGSKKGGNAKVRGLSHVSELGSVPWLFSHLKLTMHVHLFTLDDASISGSPNGQVKPDQRRWDSGPAVEQESMGTGMRKCWALAKEGVEQSSG